MIRSLQSSDIAEVFRIEQAVHVAPWTEEAFRVCIKAGYQGWVMEASERIVGFIVISFSLDECHILNLCVEHAFQRQGLGRELLVHALRHAMGQGMQIAWLEVRRSNLKAISLYQKMKFQQVGERKGYYATVAGAEDALVFAIDLHQETV